MLCIMIGYLICAFLCYGMLFSYTHSRFPSLAEEYYRENIGESLLFGLFFALSGPIGVTVTFIATGFAKYGFKVK